MVAAKLLSVSDAAPPRSSPHADFFLKSTQISPTNVADLTMFSSPKLSSPHTHMACRTPPRSPMPQPKAPIPKRKAPCEDDKQEKEERGKGKRTKKMTDKSCFKSPAKSSAPSSAADCLFSPGQEAAKRLIAMRHAFSPCKQRCSR